MTFGWRARLVALGVVGLLAGATPASQAMHNGTQTADAPPWVAYLLKNGPFTNADNCTGALIAPAYVLTAAHCVVDYDHPDGSLYRFSDENQTFIEDTWSTVASSERRVVLGRGDLDATSTGIETGLQTIFAQPGHRAIAVFEQQNGRPTQVKCDFFDRKKSCFRVKHHSATAHDIAVVRLDAPLGSSYPPVRVSRQGERVAGAATAYGYGGVARGEDDRKLSYGTFAATAAACSPAPGFCASSSTAARIAPGDSGGPWIQHLGGTDVLVGVTSIASDATKKTQGVGVADVEADYAWIASIAGLRGGSSERILVFGPGEFGTNSEGLSVESTLEASGYDVDVSVALPEDLSAYGSIWHFDAYNAISEVDQQRLIGFARAGGGLFLTGERPCCEALNSSVANIANSLIVTVGGIAVGGQGDACACQMAMPVNGGVVGQLASRPFTITSWTPAAPGIISNVSPENVFATYEGTATAAAWDSDDVVGGGRLVIFMDVNWAQSQWWDQVSAAQITQNLALFLNDLPAPPAVVPAALVALRGALIDERPQPTPTAPIE